MTSMSSGFTTDEIGFNRKNLPIPAAVAAVVAGAALIAGLIVGPGANEFVVGAQSYSTDGTGALYNVGVYLPLGGAFLAGMVATVNPCGFVMLPAFLTMFLTDQQGDAAGPQKRNATNFSKSLLKALYVSAALGAGFVLLFGVIGLVISAGAQSLTAIFPWVGFILGFVMAGLGAYLFAGGKLYNNRAQSAASRIGSPTDTSIKGYFLFGVSYAVASLSCTLPIFLGVIGSSFGDSGILIATLQFLAYGLGMTFIIAILTIGIAIFKGALVNQVRKIMPYVHPISAGVLIIVGGYLIFYWVTEGGISKSLGVG
jgi:cytochrome c-type biogenesis protein